MGSSKGKNKGEWSEFLVFLSLLKDARVYAADENLNKLDQIFYAIKSIVRNDSGNEFNYIISDDKSSVDIVTGGKVIGTIRHDTIVEDNEMIIDAISGNDESGTIHIDDIGKILENYHITKVSQDSGSKEDITIEMHDYHSGIDQVLPFSIKSFAGSNPTMVNSSKLTNVIYSIDGDLTDSEIEEINSMTVNVRGKDRTDIIGRTKKILEKCDLKFYGIQGDKYEGNLRLVDSKLPEILAEMLKLKFSTGESDISKLTEQVAAINPIGYKGSQPYYKYKISKYLMESFTGMVARSEWNGYEKAHGGYIVVKDNYEILCLHLNNRNEFENYLFNSSYFDTYSTSRSEYAEIYEENGKLFYKLNICIRLRK